MLSGFTFVQRAGHLLMLFSDTVCDSEPPASYTRRNRIALLRSMCVTVSNPHETLSQTSLCQYIPPLFLLFILIV